MLWLPERQKAIAALWLKIHALSLMGAIVQLLTQERMKIATSPYANTADHGSL